MKEEIEEIMDDEKEFILIEKEVMTLTEICENIKTILEQEAQEYRNSAVYISTMTLNPKETIAGTMNRFCIGVFKLGEGALDRIGIDKGTGKPLTPVPDYPYSPYYFLTTYESTLIETRKQLLENIFQGTALIFDGPGVRQIERDKNFNSEKEGVTDARLTWKKS